ncbi:MAG TPA: phytanoyl-CoA dioxygenase family protein, partial [Caldilineaceae bacterium]|nr:phytanoyl-CoA dioxygenase family protein [Caldilineaceae bacterium]
MRYDASVIPSRLNPTVTPELQQEVDFFLKWGYLVVDDAVTADQVDLLRAALDETFARHQSQFTHQLLEEDDRFAFLLDNPKILVRMKAILGNCVQLHSATARVTTPGAPDQDWHRDGPWPVDPDGTPFGSIPGQINCGYYLDELTMENG